MAVVQDIRPTEVLRRFDLSVASREFRRVAVPRGKAVTVIASTETGTWSNRTLEVKQVAARSSFSFATAKTIAAGGGRIQINSTELQGVDEIEIVTSGGTADASGTYATISVTVEEGDGASDGQQVLTVADLPSMTSAQLAALVTDENGTGTVVFSTNCTLVTPALGVATATSINKVAITAPATGSTITLADGKTFTLSNTLTFTGTDGSSVAFGDGGTVAYVSIFPNPGRTSARRYLGHFASQGSNGALVQSTLYAIPFWVGPSQSFTKICFALTAGAGTTNLRLGLYNDDGTGKPGTLIVDAGTVSTNAGDFGEKTVTISQTLSGLVWVAAVAQGGTPSTSRLGAIFTPFAGVTSCYSSFGVMAYSQTGVTGTLPSPWGSTYTECNTANVVPALYLSP